MTARVRLRWLDALRGVAALVVFWHHVFELLIVPATAGRSGAGFGWMIGRAIAGQNQNAVLLFFVLSGYAIRLAIEGRPLDRPQGASSYLRRRAARILPLYWLALLWTAVLGFLYGGAEGAFSLSTLLGNLVFLQTSASSRGVWFPPYGDNGPFWSLSYEVFYYLLLPLLSAVLGPRLLRTPLVDRVLIGAVVVSLAALAAGWALPNPFFSFLSLWAVWMAGFRLACLRLGGRRPWSLIPAWLIACTTAAALSVVGVPTATGMLLAEGLTIGLGLGFILAVVDGPFASIGERRLVGAVVRLFERVGSGSYALYLLHYPALLAVVAIVGMPGRGPAGMLYGSLLLTAAVVFTYWACPWLERALRRPAAWLFGLRSAESEGSERTPATAVAIPGGRGRGGTPSW